jgi:hypothetical protein
MSCGVEFDAKTQVRNLSDCLASGFMGKKEKVNE